MNSRHKSARRPWLDIRSLLALLSSGPLGPAEEAAAAAAGGSLRSNAEAFLADTEGVGLCCAAASLPPQRVRLAVLRQEAQKSVERAEDDDWE